MPRELWKGAIQFGLVHIPASLYPAEQSDELSFTMLDKRDLQPVGYKRYNKSTGDEVAYEDIVKGYEYEDGHYVALDKEDFKRANVEATQTVDIHTRQHIAALYPSDNVLVLNTLRYANELRPAKDLEVPKDLKAAGHVKQAPKKRARREAEVIDFASLLEKSLVARKRSADRAANDEEVAPRRADAGAHRKTVAARTRRKAAKPSGAGQRRFA